MKKAITVILIACAIIIFVFPMFSCNTANGNRMKEINKACGVNFSDVINDDDVLNFEKDGFYVYAKLSVNDNEVDKIIERLKDCGYYKNDLKNKDVQDKSFLSWWDAESIENSSTYIMTSSRDGDNGATCPTLTEIHFCDTNGDNTLVYIAYYKWTFV